MLTLLLPGLAAAVEVSRPPEKVEAEPRVVVPLEASDLVASRLGRQAYEQLAARVRLQSLDLVVQGQAAALADCAVTGEVAARIAVGTDGRAKATPVKGASEALASCVEVAFDDVPLPLFVERGFALDYTFRIPGGEPMAEAADRDAGFAGILFGAKAAEVEGLAAMDPKAGGVTVYSRTTDRGLLLGEQPAGVAYAFGPDGFFVAVARFTGHASRLAVRNALKARYGQPRVDPASRAPYWRGKRTLLQLAETGDETLLVVMDIERTRAARLVDALPGDATAPADLVPWLK